MGETIIGVVTTEVIDPDGENTPITIDGITDIMIKSEQVKSYNIVKLDSV